MVGAIRVFCTITIFLGSSSSIFAEPGAATADACAYSVVSVAAQSPTSIPPELAYDCYNGGRCTVFALANAMDKPTLTVGKEFAAFLRKHGETPSIASMVDFMRSKGLKLGEGERTQGADNVRQKVYGEALAQTDGKYIYIVAYDNHVVTIHAGQISNAARFYQPGSDLAQQGLSTQSIAERQAYLDRNVTIFGRMQAVYRYPVNSP